MLSLTNSLKIIWVLSNFHKTNSECWQRTPGSRKAAQSLWKEVGQNIKDKNRDKRVRGRSFLGKEMWRRSFHTAGNPLIGGSVGSFGISESNITRRKNKQTNPQNTYLTTTTSRDGEVALMHAPPPATGGWAGRRGLHYPKDGAWTHRGQYEGANVRQQPKL